MGKLKFIDEIRGIAILLVITLHTGLSIDGLGWIALHLTTYGQMGVQLFFVISAYTLCLSAISRQNEKNKIISFGIRRYFRIAPAYYFAIGLYFTYNVFKIINQTGVYAVPKDYTFVNVLSNVLFYHGVYYPANNNIVPGGWSIGTEMLFYCLFPIMFFLIRKLDLKKLLNLILIFIVAVLFSQLGLMVIDWLTGLSVKSGFIYFNIVNQIPVFAAGICYFFYQKNIDRKLPKPINMSLFLVFTSLSIYCWSYKSIIPILSSMSFIFLIQIFKENITGKMLWLSKVGKYSFSIYLLHFIVVDVVMEGVNALGLPADIKLILGVVLVSLITFLIANLLFKFIESPFIRLGSKLIKKLNT